MTWPQSWWNYRVFREGDGVLTIREAHYRKGDTDEQPPHSWTTHPIAPSAETLEELRAELWAMVQALDKPVLDDKEE